MSDGWQGSRDRLGDGGRTCGSWGGASSAAGEAAAVAAARGQGGCREEPWEQGGCCEVPWEQGGWREEPWEQGGQLPLARTVGDPDTKHGKEGSMKPSLDEDDDSLVDPHDDAEAVADRTRSRGRKRQEFKEQGLCPSQLRTRGEGKGEDKGEDSGKLVSMAVTDKGKGKVHGGKGDKGVTALEWEEFHGGWSRGASQIAEENQKAWLKAWKQEQSRLKESGSGSRVHEEAPYSVPGSEVTPPYVRGASP